MEHFKNHFNPADHSKTHVPNEFTQNLPGFIIQMQNISNHYRINHDAPSVEEIQTYLHRLKSGKASNDVDPELLKICDHPVLLEVIHRMTSNLWSNLDIADSWGNSRLKTLWKGKESKSDPVKYRGINIGSTVCKLIINIILERIRLLYEAQLSDEQNGFRKNRGTTDGIYSMKRVQQISNHKKQFVYLPFVDLTAAFDHISRNWLFESARLRFTERENLKLFDILETLYHKTTLTYHEAQSTFLVSSGVRQEGSESPCLFNLYIDFVMHVFINKCMKDNSICFFEHQYRINIRSISREERLNMRNDNIKPWEISSLPWCGYADDLILLTLDINSLQIATNILHEVFSSYGLCINDAKTVTMILDHGYLQEEYPTSIINLRNIPLQNSSEFKCLGSYLSHSERSTGDIEINHRIQMAYNKFASMSNLLQNRHIFLKTRVKF